MKNYKIIFLVFNLILLAGCSGTAQSKAKELYKDLDAKATYEKAVDYFNETVTYYRYQAIEVNSNGKRKYDSEWFNEENQYSCINSIYGYEKDSLVDCTLTLTKDKKYFQTSVGQYTYVEGREDEKKRKPRFESDDEFNKARAESAHKEIQHPFLNSILSRDGSKLLDSSKKEGDDLIIEMKYSYTYTSTNENSESIKDTTYSIMRVIIQSDGLIQSENIERYKDDQFKEKLFEVEAIYKDFNKKKSFNFNEEVKRLKDLEGKDIHVIKDRITF